MILIPALGQVHAYHDAGDNAFSPAGFPPIGFEYTVDLSGNARLLAADVVEPVSAELKFVVAGVKKSGVPSISLTLTDGTLTLGDETYSFTHGPATIIPFTFDIHGLSEDSSKILKLSANVGSPLPILTSDETKDVWPAKREKSGSIQIGIQNWSFNDFRGSISPVEVEEVILPVSVSNADLVDALGSRISEVSVGQQVLVQSDISNNKIVMQDFAFILQIKDSDDIIVSISWMQGSINPQQSLNVAQSWLPDSSGKYKAQIFVWQSIINPIPLSSGVTELEINVLA